MSMHTRCTHCGAVFRVTLLQLQSSSGRVRCGVCHEAFDAFVHLRAAEPAETDATTPVVAPESAPQVALPASVGELETPFPEVPTPDPDDEAEADASLRTCPDVDAEAMSRGAANDGQVAADGAAAEGCPTEGVDVLVAEAQADAPVETETLPPVRRPEPRRPRRWPLALGVACLAMLLAGQVTYHFRTQIVAAVPALRAPAERLCDLAGCRIPLPELSDRLAIEMSDLRALDPARPNRVVLIATLRNTAPVAQAHPFVELSFTDARDQVTARKVLAPRDYLEAPATVRDGIGPHAEVPIRLQFDVSDLEVSGYRLYLFHR